MREEIGPQLPLRRKHTINGNRCDRLSGCRNAKLLGEALSDPLSCRGGDD
jgi:hypothetical protein